MKKYDKDRVDWQCSRLLSMELKTYQFINDDSILVYDTDELLFVNCKFAATVRWWTRPYIVSQDKMWAFAVDFCYV